MKRKDIKRGTLFTMAFVAVAYIGMLTAIWINRSRHEQPDKYATGSHISWSDTLSNKASARASLKGMDAEIERFMGRWNIRGISLAVSRNDSLLLARGFGWADREEGKKMEPTNIMRMASASKLVTAIAVMKLCESGKLNLNARIFGDDGILNDTAFTNSIRDKRHLDITVDNLLRHQGGFTLGAGDPMFNTKDIILAKHLKHAPSNDELVKIVLGRRLGFNPGAGRKYSNFGYFLLSLAIEKVTGKSYWDYVEEEVLKPAGCYGFRPATNYYAERSAREVRYYAPDDELIEEFNGSGKMVPRIYGGSNVNGLMGAGGWCASAADLNRLVAAVDKQPGVKDILKASSIDTLTAHSDKEKLSRGWSEADAHGKWTRTGTLSSTHALVERFPNGECWVILTNTGVWTGHNFSRDLSRLIEKLRSRYGTSLPRQNLWH